jgi:hypothetical protein
MLIGKWEKVFQMLGCEGVPLDHCIVRQLYWYLQRDTSLIEEICIFAFFVKRRDSKNIDNLIK